MGGVLTITLNPAIDVAMEVEALVALKKMRGSVPTYEVGGGGINVSRILKELDLEAPCFYTAGGHHGTLFTEKVKHQGLVGIPFQIEGETRENFSVKVNATGDHFRFGVPGPQIQKTEQENLYFVLTQLAKDYETLVFSGSFPLGTNIADLSIAVNKCSRKRFKQVWFDTSSKALKACLEGGGVFGIKPNLDELSELVGQPLDSFQKGIDAGKALLESSSLQWILLSNGGDGAALLGETEGYSVKAPDIDAASAIGAGDSSLAGAIFGFHEGMTPSEILRYAVACGTATAETPGTQLSQKSAILAMLNRVQIPEKLY